MKKLLTALALAATFAVPAWAATQTVTLSVPRNVLRDLPDHRQNGDFQD